MLSAIWALIEAIPILDKWVGLIVSSYHAYKKSKEEALIDKATDHQANAQTSEDKKKAADEIADAFRNL